MSPALRKKRRAQYTSSLLGFQYGWIALSTMHPLQLHVHMYIMYYIPQTQYTCTMFKHCRFIVPKLSILSPHVQICTTLTVARPYMYNVYIGVLEMHGQHIPLKGLATVNFCWSMTPFHHQPTLSI